MTAPTLTEPQRRALLWLAETPQEWRVPDAQENNAFVLAFGLGNLVSLGLAQRYRTDSGRRLSLWRLTSAGIQAAKELAA